MSQNHLGTMGPEPRTAWVGCNDDSSAGEPLVPPEVTYTTWLCPKVGHPCSDAARPQTKTHVPAYILRPISICVSRTHGFQLGLHTPHATDGIRRLLYWPSLKAPMLTTAPLELLLPSCLVSSGVPEGPEPPLCRT